MSKKILFLINNLGIGGAETVFVNDANFLYKEGCEVYFVLLYGDNDKSPLLTNLEIEGRNIFFLKAKNLFDFRAYFKFRKIIKNLGQVSVYSTLNDSVFFSRFAVLFAKDVELFIREANVAYPKPKVFKIFDLLMNFTVKRIIVVSEEVGRSIIAYNPIYKDKIVVLYNGVNIPEKCHVDDAKTILANGSLTPKKDPRTLILAFIEVLRSCPEAMLRIIGEGVMRSELESLIREKGLDDKVKLLGNLGRQFVNEEYMKASVFVLSSTREGCPNVLLEAMSYGVPSVATRVGAVPEIIDDGKSGFVVPVKDVNGIADKITLLLKNSMLRNNIGDMGRQRITEKFSMDRHLRELNHIFFS